MRNKRCVHTTWVCAAVIGALIGLTATPGTASAVMYNLDYIFSPPIGTSAPLGTVTLTDLGTAVRFELTNLAGAGSKLDSLYFNFDHAGVTPNQLSFSNVSAGAGTYQTTLAPTASSTVSSLKADGDGYYDGKFAYTTNNFLGDHQTLSFDLSITGQNLDVSDFHFSSISGGGTGTYFMASHIQNFAGDTSLWVGTTQTVAPVPLPAGAWLFGSGVLALARFARRNSLVRA